MKDIITAVASRLASIPATLTVQDGILISFLISTESYDPLVKIAQDRTVAMDVRSRIMDALMTQLRVKSSRVTRDEALVKAVTDLAGVHLSREEVEQWFSLGSDVLMGKLESQSSSVEEIPAHGYLIISQNRNNAEFLKSVVSNTNIDTRLRLYAYAFLVQNHDQHVWSADLDEKVSDLLKSISKMENMEHLSESLFGFMELAAMNIAVVMFMKNQLSKQLPIPLFSDSNIKSQIQKVMQTSIARGEDNAESSHRYGSELFKTHGSVLQVQSRVPIARIGLLQ